MKCGSCGTEIERCACGLSEAEHVAMEAALMCESCQRKVNRQWLEQAQAAVAKDEADAT